MQQTLVHFLNHGLLPFIGRMEQVERIEQFWRQTADSTGLRALILVGEAGVGKSRLIEEVIPRIGIAGGAVIHAKLYPDSATSVAPLLARALGRSNVAQSLLKSEPEESLAGVIAALVRICSLRPTLIVIEDIHLLQGDALREFASLLERLSDEPLSLLCAARPVELAVRATLERFLVDEIELTGLTSGDISDLCRQVFDQEVGHELAATLEEKTCGNALALRSALRGALKSAPAPGGRITKGPPVWGRIDRSKLAEALDRNVRLLSEGMAAHLNDEEKHAAEQVASLGEVFARETGMALLGAADRADQILSQLTFKGIITTAISTSNALDEHRSNYPLLAFTHSLLHRHFVEHGNVDASMLVRVVADNLPLYSVTPFLRLAELEPAPTEGGEREMRVFDRALRIGFRLRTGADWRYEEILLKAAHVIIYSCSKQWSEEDSILRRARLIRADGSVLQHVETALQRRDHYLTLLELTSDERFESLRIHHLHALAQIYWNEGFFRFLPVAEPHQMAVWLDRTRQFVERHPELKSTRDYVDYLSELARFASEGYGPIDVAGVEEVLNDLLRTPGLDPELARYAHIIVLPHFLDVYSTPEEMGVRARQLAELEEMIEPTDTRAIDNLSFPRTHLLTSMLCVDELLVAAEDGYQRARTTSSWQRIIQFAMSKMYARLLIDLDFESAVVTSREILAMIPEKAKENDVYDTWIAQYLCRAAVLSHDDARIIATLEQFDYNRSTMGALYSQILALATGDLHEVVGTVEPAEPIEVVARDLALLVLGRSDAERDSVLQATINELAGPVFQLDSLVAHSHLLRLLTMLPESENNGSMGAAVVAAIQRTLAAQLGFLAGRELHRIMAAVIETFARFLPKGELTAWKSRCAEIRKRRGEDRDRGHDQGKIHLTMFGAVTITQAGGEPERVKGAQLCTLLGLMVADSLQETPLSQREFMALAIGGDRDPDSARKSLNFAVFRLRELLGTPQAIDTAGETPRLVRDLVEADFIEATEALERAADALGDGALMRAVPDLLESLRTSAGQVAYPALYEEFFEAAREDYETRLRRVTLGVARALIREGDTASAEEVLTRSYEAMADDEELGELLQTVLVRQGKRARAARISLRVAEEA